MKRASLRVEYMSRLVDRLCRRPAYHAIIQRLVAAGREDDERHPFLVGCSEGSPHPHLIEVADVNLGLTGSVRSRRAPAPERIGHLAIEPLQSTEVPADKVQIADAIGPQPFTTARIAESKVNREVIRRHRLRQLVFDLVKFLVVQHKALLTAD